MPKKIGSVDRSTLVNAALPNATKSYTVISHSYVINTILQALEDNNFEVTAEEYRCTLDAQVAHGAFIISDVDDPELSMVYSFTNSYNKSLRFRSGIGAQVMTNGAYMICDMDHWNRKHTGTADNETETLIKAHIGNASKYFDQLKQAKNLMKNVSVDKSAVGQTIGELFINDFITIDQVSMIAKEYQNPSFTYGVPANSLWAFYNHVIYALRQSHPSKWMQNQISVHLFFCAKFELDIFDDEAPAANEQLAMEQLIDETEALPLLPGFESLAAQAPLTEDPTPIEDPNQIDLEDSIKEVLAEKEEVIEEVEKETMEEIIPKPEPEQVMLPEPEPVIVPEVKAEEPAVTEAQGTNAEEMYFPTADYPGVNLGEVFESEDIYYTGVRFEEIDGEEFIVCVPISADEMGEMNEMSSEEFAENIKVESEEPVTEVVESNPIPLEEMAHANNTHVDPLEDIEVPVAATDEDPAIKKIITNELEEIYGYPPVFTYVLINNQYNITLDSGETITLASNYINSML